MTDDLVARLPTDAAARRLPEFIKTLRTNRSARRESVYASDNVYALLDALDTLEAERDKWDRRVAYDELQAREHENRATQQRQIDALTIRAEAAERQLAEAYERAADKADELSGCSNGYIAAAIRKLAQEVK